MLFGAARPLLMVIVSGIFAVSVSAQTTPGKPEVLKRIEPGLENAVKWEWHVEPSPGWVSPAPSPTPTPTPAVATLPTPESRPTLYEVKHGDALVLIGKKFGLSVSQLKSFNQLKGNTIRVGQKLKIPTVAEVNAMAPPVKKHKSSETPAGKPAPETGTEVGKLRLQVFLDRELFSAGPIAADPGPPFTRVLLLYQSTHEDAKDDASLGAKAQAAVARYLHPVQTESGRLPLYCASESGNGGGNTNSALGASAFGKTNGALARHCQESTSNLSATGFDADAGLSNSVGVCLGTLSLPGILSAQSER